jgi:choline dehydrogenase-like flavoprotein
MNRFAVEASVYVLAAGGLENPRLLLASTNRSQAGVGNAHDLVGRFYMDHPCAQGTSTVDLRGLTHEQVAHLMMFAEHVDPAYGKVQFRLTFSQRMQREERLLNHALRADFASSVHSTKGYRAARRLSARLRSKATDDLGQDISTSAASDVLDVLKDSPALLQHGLRRVRGSAQPTCMYVHDQMEQEPDPRSRVTLDWSRRDRWGLPRLRLDWRVGESTYTSQARMHQLFKEVLHRAGIDSVQSSILEHPGVRPAVTEMKHPSGTTRMSTDPAQGVVDPNMRVHGVENLYIAGSSTFPTVGHANPTLLIVALAARLAEHLRLRR